MPRIAVSTSAGKTTVLELLDLDKSRIAFTYCSPSKYATGISLSPTALVTISMARFEDSANTTCASASRRDASKRPSALKIAACF